MPKYHFYQVDVFTDQAFGGNPLAVIPDGVGLSSGQMQSIALEMNLSETTFVLPAEDPEADFKVRIFTPSRELPFAGHPVVGTHWLLAHIGQVALEEPITTVRFELGVGVRAAQLHVTAGKVTKVVMDHQRPEFFATASEEQIERLATGLGLRSEAILETGWPAQVVSTGSRQLFVPVRTLADVQSLQPSKQDASALNSVFDELDPVKKDVHVVMVLTLETESDQSDVHTRMFAPRFGIREDPATGSASGGLGAYLLKNRIIDATPPTTYITSEQGIEAGRPSTIYIEVDGPPGDITMVRVGGEVVPLIEGVMEW
ncbi:MAG: PhzF family phenazine biosynthesis protein [Chloroflexota bacterium]|nr:MAG: PhzF family phenazine biosynthesis protein [Chloroflexota bacterium]